MGKKHIKEVRDTNILKAYRFVLVETKGCCIRIYPALSDSEGRKRVVVIVEPDDGYEAESGISTIHVIEKKDGD